MYLRQVISLFVPFLPFPGHFIHTYPTPISIPFLFVFSLKANCWFIFEEDNPFKKIFYTPCLPPTSASMTDLHKMHFSQNSIFYKSLFHLLVEPAIVTTPTTTQDNLNTVVGLDTTRGSRTTGAIGCNFIASNGKIKIIWVIEQESDKK